MERKKFWHLLRQRDRVIAVKETPDIGLVRESDEFSDAGRRAEHFVRAGCDQTMHPFWQRASAAFMQRTG